MKGLNRQEACSSSPCGYATHHHMLENRLEFGAHHPLRPARRTPSHPFPPGHESDAPLEGDAFFRPLGPCADPEAFPIGLARILVAPATARARSMTGATTRCVAERSPSYC